MGSHKACEPFVFRGALRGLQLACAKDKYAVTDGAPWIRQQYHRQLPMINNPVLWAWLFTVDRRAQPRGRCGHRGRCCLVLVGFDERRGNLHFGLGLVTIPVIALHLTEVEPKRVEP